MRPVELLIPASSLEVLKIAVIYGADAVYIGGEVFGLRAKAKNFSMEDMAEGIQFAHEHGVKVYVTANILAHNGRCKRVLYPVKGNQAGCPDYFRPGYLYHCKRNLPGNRASYQYPGQ